MNAVDVLPLRSPTLPPATHTNCWRLGGPEGIHVDPAPPWPEERADLVGARPQAVLLTHHHQDHIGAAEFLREQSGAPIWAHPRTAERLPFAVDRLLDEGEVLEDAAGRRWTCLLTPGHAPGHLCLLDEDGQSLVAGDMVAGVGTIVLDPDDGGLADYLSSLERLLALGPRRLLPAHGPIIEPAEALLRQYIAHRHMRTEMVRAAIAGQGPCRPEELVPRIYGELPELIAFVAARQVRCHLIWLAERGELADLGDGRWQGG
jgi:glyoxylase-like metal-dependent hydrolase (beta-lactamase superfamily II)